MDLHQRFVQLGIQRKNLTRQLQALLPEIFKQEIFKKHGCMTIYEYAWKFAGFSKNLVEKIMRTSKHLKNKPCLMRLIEKEGVHKVAMVATLATPETDKIFAEHVKNMSKPALFEYAKEIRRNGELASGCDLGLFGAEIGGSVSDGSASAMAASDAPVASPCRAVPAKIKIELDDEMQIIFLQLKKNLQKEFKRDFSNKEALKIMLKKMVNANEKVAETKSVPGNGLSTMLIRENKITRYIHVNQKREMLEQQKCSYPGCNKPQMIIHHRDRFSTSQSHDSIIPLCKEHHEFAHNGLIKNETGDPQDWKLNLQPELNFVDKLVLKYRKI